MVRQKGSHVRMGKKTDEGTIKVTVPCIHLSKRELPE
ncbi:MULTISPECIES: hypothetical protein [unclassified Archaeoglobus]